MTASPLAVVSYYLASNQTIVLNTETPVQFTTLDSANSYGTVRGTYNTSNYTFTNTSTSTALYFISASVYLGSSYVQAVLKIVKNGSATFAVSAINTQAAGTTSAAIVLQPNETIQIVYAQPTGSVTPLVAAGNLTRLTITQLDNVLGNSGPTGPAGAAGSGGGGGTFVGGPAATVSYSQSTQASPATVAIAAGGTGTIVNWGAVADANQSTGTTGLTYASGVFTNATTSVMPVLVEYSILTDVTGGGASFVGVTPSGGSLTKYGSMLNENNSFVNSFTVLLAANATFAVYYMDNLACNIQTTSRITATPMTGAQGATGPIGNVSMVDYTASGSQVVTSSISLLTWPNTDSTQTFGNIGLGPGTYSGQFINNTSSNLPLFIEYSVFLNTTLGGYTTIGINGTNTTYGTEFGGTYTTTNGFNNSFTLLLPPAASFGVYYTDNGTATIQNARLSITLLTAGGQGATGATGPMAPTVSSTIVSLIPATTQAISASALTLVNWATLDTVQSSTTLGAMGLTNASGAFTNTTSQNMTLSVQYSVFLNVTGGGYTVIRVGGVDYAGRYNDNVAATNSFTVVLAPAATLGVYYLDNSAVTVQTSSRLTLTLLVSGLQGPTGPSIWGLTGTTAYYSGNVTVGTGSSPANLAVIGTINNMTVGSGTGAFNTIVGTNALPMNTTGQNNMVIGYNAGYTPQGFTGSNNIYVGAYANPSSGSATNEIVIGQGATGYGNNTVTIGNSQTLSTTLFGTVRNLTYSVAIPTVQTAVIIPNAANVFTAAGTGVWLVSVNADQKASGVAYVSYSTSGATTVFGGFSTSAFVTLVSNGLGISLNVSNAAVTGTYAVNLLKLN